MGMRSSPALLSRNTDLSRSASLRKSKRGRKGGSRARDGTLLARDESRLLHAWQLLAIAIIAIALSGASPGVAHGAEAKHAVPSIAKQVSLDGREYSDEVTAKAGTPLHYRLELTLPELLRECKTIDYTVRDVPHENVQIDMDSIAAKLVDADGNEKASLNPVASKSGQAALFDLGDISKLDVDLQYGDRILVTYDARTAKDARAGSYVNTAKLIYDIGNGPEKTVDVIAKVNIPASPAAPPAASPDPGKPQSASALPKTGDAMAGAAVACSAAALGALLVAVLSRRKHD